MRQSSRAGKVSGDDCLPENISFGDVSIDFANMELVRAGKESRLTVTELNLLRYMLRNAGRVMAREEILASVWGYADGRETRTLDAHIWKLRQKMERNPHRPVYLRTVQCVGYRLTV
jgi:two-component system alkaline phosphatase synthesis response regulator PhoP